MAIGGAEDKIKKRVILSEFTRMAGGEKARIVIVPAASMMPRERGDLYASLFRELGAADVDVVHVANRPEANSPLVVECLERATGVFVTGGVQLRLISMLGGTEMSASIRALLARGGVYGGTSAGAAVISSHMIVTGRGGLRVRRGMVDMAPGLGLVHDVIIDQHFSQRGRLGRLIASVGLNPQFLGVGIDEDTAAIFSPGGTVEVIGEGQVAVLDASQVTRTNLDIVPKTKPFSIVGLQMHLLTDGNRFNLRTRSAEDPSEVVRLTPSRKKA